MAEKIADRVVETTTTTGAGTYSLGGAKQGYRTFVAGIEDGNTCRYMVTDGVDWEVGLGTVTDGAPDTLSRDSIEASSNVDAAVNWGAGSKDVYHVLSAAAINAFLSAPGRSFDFPEADGLMIIGPLAAENGTEVIAYKLSFTSSLYYVNMLSSNLTADRDYEFPDEDGLLVVGSLVAPGNFEIIAYP